MRRSTLACLPALAVLGCTVFGYTVPGCAARGSATRGDLRFQDGARASVVQVGDETSPAEIDRLRREAMGRSERLYLWIDVGRNPRLAAARPEWVAGMGSHEDWRRGRPDAPRPGPGERIGVSPWTPIWYRAVLENRRLAIGKLLGGRTEGIAGVFLNQVQGSPSACGCGNDQCRWTADYRMPGGPERVRDAPAALLLAALKRDVPAVEWIPVWVIECEEHDSPGEGSTGYCGDVGCFQGLCWKESTKEMEAVAKEAAGPIALLAAEKPFRRKLPRYAPGGWLAECLKDVESIPRAHGRTGWPAGRLIAVVEGEGLSKAESDALARSSLAAGVKGVLVSSQGFEEGWEPRIIPCVQPPGPGAGPVEQTDGAHGRH